MAMTFLHHTFAGFACLVLVSLSNCAPSEVASPPRDAAPADALADVSRDLPADTTRDGPCGDGGVCSGGMRCDLARMRCVDCLATNHCSGATPVCASGRCVAATPCTSSRMCPGQVCDLNQMRCVDCVADAECDAGLRCVANVCAASVACRSSRDCSAAGLVCDTSRMRCVECLEDRDCPMGQRCDADRVCVSPAPCAPGTSTCASNLRVRTCDAMGMPVERDCAVGEICLGGVCRMLLCSPGSVSCESTSARRTCNSEGMGYAVVPCAAGESCVAGECRAPGCTPGTATCTSTAERRVCNSDGMTFTTMACPAGQTCASGMCSTGSFCASGQTLCGATCFDLQRDAANCGMCGRACPAGMTCSAGACSAPAATPAPMAAVRAYHAQVTLSDGRVLVAGGVDARGDSSRSAEVYDPATNRWSAAASMMTSFRGAHGALLRDGRVAISGFVDGGPGGAVDVYTPSTNTWARLGVASVSPTATLVVTHELEGRLYALDLDGRFVHRYNFASGMWSTLARFVGADFGSSTAVVMDARGLLHAFGGGTAAPTLHALYSPADDLWTTAPALSEWRPYAACVLGPDGRIYVSGGLSAPTTTAVTTNDARALDLTSNSFSPLAALPETRGAHGASLLSGGRVLITGGARVTGGAMTQYLNTTAIYTIATNTWR